MAQHLVVGDLGPLLVVVGLTGPGFGRSGVLRHPLVALPLWALNLCLWHLPVLYDAALRHESIHALQHALFFACGVLLWAALLLPGPAWFGIGAKIGYVATAWLVGTALAQVFIWSGSAYEPYREAPRLWGITPHGDQVAGGGLMMFEGTVVMVGVIVWLLLGVLQEPDQVAAESAT
jgi:putative membrane protein